MILQEPDRTPYDVRFRLFGVDVRIHPFFWLFTVLLSGGGSLKGVLIWLAAVMLSLLVHEFGHVIAFRYYGIRSFVVLYSFGGLAIPQGSGYGGSFGPRLTAGANAVVAFAGPAFEILSALAVLGVMQAVGSGVEFYFGGPLGIEIDPGSLGFSPLLDAFLYIYVVISLFWGLINLLPIFHLDGGRISNALFERIDPQTGLKQTLILSMLTAGFVALVMLVRLQSYFNTLLFVYLGYMSYRIYEQLGFRGRRW